MQVSSICLEVIGLFLTKLTPDVNVICMLLLCYYTYDVIE